MYEHLAGRLASKSPSEAVVECAGVGYLLKIPLSTYEALPAAGGACRVLAHLYVREDTQALFGFATRQEREVFRKLLGISGIGPTVALTVLSGMPVAELARAVADGNSGALKRIKGIGEKTAKRMVLELKGVLDDLVVPVASPLAGGPEAADAVRALVNLGYTAKSAEEMVARTAKKLGPEAPVEDIIRGALASAG